MKPVITVFTPTYNRGELLNKLYSSLVKQTFKDFEWLIYDDGSKDDTKKRVETLVKENKINIRYYYGENSGKHAAINKGTELAKGELFFIVDSDDYLTNNSLELVNEAWNSVEKSKDEKIVGVGGRRFLINKENRKFNFENKYYDADAIKFNLIDGNIQDKAEVYKTSFLRRYKFPEFKGEKFITEALIWYKIAQDGYKLRWFNEDIYVCEYLDDGLSSNFYKVRVNSIKGTCHSYNEMSTYRLPWKFRLRYKINYFRYGLIKYSSKVLKNELKSTEFYRIAHFIGILLKFKDTLANSS
ncbi:MAG: glycosyltransferase family 2 protein [Clostridium sp.]|nr:glycosyltransferase family 2 protein [Clostridium sp.]MDU7084659.1 glycosyltransferase family 2 protein [Clostridium sp.]